MSDNDPFAEPGDNERTVIKPSPAGRHRSSSPEPMEQPRHDPEPQAAGDEDAGASSFGVPQRSQQRASADEARTIEQAMTGMNRLNACGSTLFLLVSRIRNRAQHMDPDALRSSVTGEVRAFESRALKAGIDPQHIRVARYAICATLDDVVLNTPWGGQSNWTMQTMVGTFHKEVVGGDRFFDLLSRLEQDPPNNIDLLEFLYACLSLGFEGRLRVEEGGPDKHLRIRNGLARIIRAQRGPVEQDLSPSWKGVEVPHKPRSIWLLVWIVMGGLTAVLAVTFLVFSILLDGRSERTVGFMTSLEGTLPASLARRAPPPKEYPRPPPLEPEADPLVQVAEFLQPEIEEKVVTVLPQANTIVVRMVGSGMFPSGSDQVRPEFEESIRRVAGSLNDEPGRIIVAGHSDNIPIRSGRWANNMALSLARAESVERIVKQELNDPSRVSAEGRGEREPIATNSTKTGRALNRRIEIILVPDPSQ